MNSEMQQLNNIDKLAKLKKCRRLCHSSIERLEQCADDGVANASEDFINGYALAIYRAMAGYIEENRYQLVGASFLRQRAVAE